MGFQVSFVKDQFQKFENFQLQGLISTKPYRSVIFLVENFPHFGRNIFEKEHSVNIPFFLDMHCDQNPKTADNFKKFKNCHNCLQYERVLKIFIFSYLEYYQIWLKYNYRLLPLRQHQKIEIKKFFF